jgi:large conductance mechanosensitive channel
MAIWTDFKKFAIKGNVIDLAVAVIIGGAFGKIVDALVKDVIMPPFGLLLGKVNFQSLYIQLGDKEYASLAEAKAAGAPTIDYGSFLSTLLEFFILAIVVFLMVRQIHRLTHHKDAPAPRECPMCTKTIPTKAKRCPECTADLVSKDTKDSEKDAKDSEPALG